VLLSFSITSCNSCDNKKTKNRTITLHVNTADITHNNISTTCNFGKAQKAGISNEEFTITADVGDIITWEGVAIQPSEGEITITRIIYAGGTKIFVNDELPGKNKVVVGTVKHSTKGKPDFKYKIFFTVNNSNPPYKIDPKIQVN